MMRTHVIVPEDLVRAVDELVGKRKRSRFFASAVEEKLAHIRRRHAAAAAGGSLSGEEVPGWESPERGAEWVRALREADRDRLEKILGS